MRSFVSGCLRGGALVGALAAAVMVLAACGGDAGGSGTPPIGGTPSAPVDGPAWTNFGGNAQHTAQSAIATQSLDTIRWSTPVDLAPPYRPSGALLAHYGSPVITSHNTVLVPVVTTTGFRVEARAGGNGVQIWSDTTDYVMPPPHNWVPSYNLALTSANRVYAPGAGGKLLYRDNADNASAAWQTLVFYAGYNAASAAFNASVYINTPITVDAQGNAFFGFMVTGANPAGLTSGLARIGADGTGSWISAATVSGDATIAKVAMNSAPAVSNDGQTVYVVVNTASAANAQGVQYGYLLALDSHTLALRRKVALIDPAAASSARISDDGTSSPLVGPDGEVYIGVLETTFGTHNGRGWLLHFDSTLATSKAPGAFGWDNTPSVVPASMVSGYAGSSSYLLLTKYNNYAGAGNGDGQSYTPTAVGADGTVYAVNNATLFAAGR